MNALRDYVSDVFFEVLATKIVERLERFQGARQRLFDLERAAEYLGLTPEALRQKAIAGEIPKVDLDRRLRFDVRDLDCLIDSRKR